MLVAVSTVMDSPEHVRRYVEGNLAGGVDHLVVFLDKPSGDRQDEVATLLDEHPRVTCVRAGGQWWGGTRPAELNARQCTNANVVKSVLAGLGHPEAWVLHEDGDEVARVDRSLLEDPSRDVVRLGVREAVSHAGWQGDPDLFKRELDEPDLELLHGLGLVAEPTNQSFLRGHVMGKSAVRAGAEAWLTLHKVVGPDRAALPAYEHEDLAVFHYESYSAADFVRKWTSMVASGPKASYRAERRTMARTLRALISRGLEPDALERALRRYYDRFVAEDVEALRDVGVLEQVDPLAPLPDLGPGLGADLAAALAAGIEEHRGAEKSAYFKGSSPASPARGDGDGGRRKGLGQRLRAATGG